MAVRNSGARQDTWVIRLFLGATPLGVWDKKSGGEVDSDDTKYRPGAMVPPINLGGTKTTGNITLSRLYDRVDDGAKIQSLINGAGKAIVKISQKVMDVDGHEFGKAIIYTGKLKRVTPPEVDSESSAAAMIEIEVGVEGYPTTA